jgi:hypothetical protein
MGEAFAAVVYILCFLTSAACAWLLGRSYRANGAPLLFWSSVCFAFLAANNLVLMIDLLIFPQMFDLRIVRLLLALAAVTSLIWGFIWRAEED